MLVLSEVARSDRRDGSRPAPALPRRLPVGRVHGGLPDRGRAGEDGRGDSIWDTFCRRPGRIADGQHRRRRLRPLSPLAGGRRPDRGPRRERLPLLHRVAARSSPAATARSTRPGLDFYDRLVDGLAERGIAPCPRCTTGTCRRRCEDRGGWLNRDTAHRFADVRRDRRRTPRRPRRAVDHAQRAVRDGVRLRVRPARAGPRAVLDALPTAHHQLLGHGLAVAALRAAGVRKVAIANNYTPARPASDGPRTSRRPRPSTTC